MVIGNGFQKPVALNPMDPEYVKLQREEVVKAYRDKVIALQEEIKELEERRTGISSEILEAFKAEREKIAGLEESARTKKEKTDEGALLLKKAMETFNSEREAEAAKISFASGELEKTRVFLEAKSKHLVEESDKLRKDKDELQKQKSGIEATGNELQARIFDLSQQRIALEAEQHEFKNIKKEYEEKHLSIEDERKSVDNARFQMEQAAIKMQGVQKEAAAKIYEAKSLSSRIIEETSTLEELRKSKAEQLATIKSESDRIQERERQVSIRERAFANESAIKTRQLDEREARIKTLEKGI